MSRCGFGISQCSILLLKKAIKLPQSPTSLQRSLDCNAGHYRLSKTQTNYLSLHAKTAANSFE